MFFNVDRIAVLAGLDAGSSSGLMREGADMSKPVTPAPGAKPAAPKPMAPAAKMPPAAAKPPPAPAAAPAKEGDDLDADEAYEGDHAYEMMHGQEMDEYMDTMGGMDYDPVVYEVDEMQIMEALVDMRERRLEEGKVRATVRTEINDILNEMESGSRWMYGNRSTSNSRKGQVARGFLGPGFR